MKYENKEIKQLYGFQFGLMVVGAILTLIGIVVLVTGFLPTNATDDNLMLIVGGMLAVVGTVLFGFNAYQIFLAMQMESISGITAKQVDKEAFGEQAKFFELTHVLTTENFLVGFTCDIGNQRFSQRAFKYDEVRRIYGYNAKHKELGGLPGKGRYKIIVLASDGKEYTISEIQSNGYVKANVIEEMNGILEECRKRVPEIEYGPENMKTRKYTFAYYVLMAGEPDHWYEGEEAASRVSDEIRKDVAESFEADNLTYRYSEKDAIVKTSMELLDDGNAEVTISYFGDREEDIAALGDYLQNMFDTGWGDGFEYDDRMVFFHKGWLKDNIAKKVEN